MNSAPLLLIPFAAMALLSGQPSNRPLSSQSEADQLLLEQLHQVSSSLGLSDEEGHGKYSSSRHDRARRREQGLHTGHLTSPGLTQSEGYYSAARGLTPEDEWQQMFPSYAVQLAAAR